MTLNAPPRLDIPMDTDRFNGSLRSSKWHAVVETLDDTFEVSQLYNGPLPGLPEARIVCLSSGNSDSPVRVLVDAVPTSISRPVLVASRAVARVFTSRARDRAAVLENIALRIHMVELDVDPTDIPPVPQTTGLDGGLRLTHSVTNSEAWMNLVESTNYFRPTLALDLRDAGLAVPNAHLALVLHSLTQTVNGERSLNHGGELAAEAIASNVQQRGIALHVGTDQERASAKLQLISARALVRHIPAYPFLSTTTAATVMNSSVGITALALGLHELDRAIALVESVAAGIDQSIHEHLAAGT